MTEEVSKIELLELTAEVVAAHVSNNTVPTEQLPQLIREIYGTLQSMDNQPAPKEELVPAVPIKKSITRDFLICLEDGKKLKMLKRHLQTVYNLTPEEYRERWGLAADYPMVAPSYAERRSELAKQIGLGKKRRRRKRS